RHHIHDVVSGKDSDPPARPIFAQARAQNDRQSHGAETAHRMDDSRPGKVDIAVTEIQRRSDLREPTATPRPAAGDRVKNRADEKFAQQKCPEGDALTDGAD